MTGYKLWHARVVLMGVLEYVFPSERMPHAEGRTLRVCMHRVHRLNLNSLHTCVCSGGKSGFAAAIWDSCYQLLQH